MPNLATIIIAGFLFIIVSLIVHHLYSEKKRGKSSCGYGCENCALKDTCHSKTNKQSGH